MESDIKRQHSLALCPSATYPTTPFNTTYSFAVKWFRVLLCITNNLIKHQSFVYIQIVLFLTIQFKLFVCTEFKYQTVLFSPHR